MFLIKERPSGGIESADLGWWANDLERFEHGICWTRDRSKAQRFSTLELATDWAVRVGGNVEHEHNGVMSNETR